MTTSTRRAFGAQTRNCVPPPSTGSAPIGSRRQAIPLGEAGAFVKRDDADPDMLMPVDGAGLVPARRSAVVGIPPFHHFTISPFPHFTISPFHHFAILKNHRRQIPAIQ